MSANHAVQPASGRLAAGRHLLPIRVYYEDTDFSGVVYHANYLRYLERGRTEFIRAIGVDQSEVFRETGVHFVVRAMTVEFLRPAMMDDAVAVETAVTEIGGPLMKLGQTILRRDEVLVTAAVTIVCVKAGRPQRPPSLLRQAFLDAQAAAGR